MENPFHQGWRRRKNRLSPAAGRLTLELAGPATGRFVTTVHWAAEPSVGDCSITTSGRIDGQARLNEEYWDTVIANATGALTIILPELVALEAPTVAITCHE